MKKILIIIFMLIFGIVSLASALFSDGFEDGTTDAWDTVYTDGGDLTITTGAKLHGNYGMNVVINDTDAKFVQDKTPSTETRVRVRAYFDPNGVEMAENDEFHIFILWYQDWGEAGGVKVKYSSGYTVYHYAQTDGGWSWGTAYAITDAPHCFEFDYFANAGGGFHSLWIDGVLKETKGSLDNDTRTIDSVVFGPKNTAVGTSGTVFYDTFASNDDGSLIGQIGDNAIMFGTNF